MADPPGEMPAAHPHHGAPERVRLDVPGVGTVDAFVSRAVPGAAELVLSPAGGPARRLTPRVLHRRRCRATPPDGPEGRFVDGELLAVPGRDGRFREDLVHLLFGVDVHPFAGRTSAEAQDAPPAPGWPGPGYGPTSARPAAPEPPARRVHDRVEVVRPVTLVPARMGAGFLDARTRDLSAGGVLLDGADGVREGDSVRLLLELTPGSILDAAGRVVRVLPDAHAAVRLEHLTGDARARLQRHVELRRAAALAALRAAG